MCTYSMVVDHYIDKWTPYVPVVPIVPYISPNTTPPPILPFTTINIAPQITQAEIDEFRKLLDRAREYDKKNSEPDCENEKKKETLLVLAKQLGIEINFL